MAASSASLPRLSLDELVALNDEIRALVGAGVPLERGLAALARDLPGSLGRVARELARRGEQGESLEVAIGSMTASLPPVYRAVIRAGARSGRLPEALQALATASRRLAETRAEVSSALTYPLLVVLTAWALLVFFLAKVGPTLFIAMEDFGVRGAARVGAALHVGDVGWGVALGVPLVIVVGAAVWAWMARRAMMMQSTWSGILVGWLPWVGRMLRATRAAVLSDLLAMLVEAGVPLPESLRLAAEATGNRRMRRGAAAVADLLERSGQADQAAVLQSGLPPLMIWTIRSGQSRDRLVDTLRYAARTYHRRARYHADRARVLLPVAVTLAVGGTSTLAYALIVFVPWITLLGRLAQA